MPIPSRRPGDPLDLHVTTSRVPAGVPTGGQFAATVRSEPDVSLGVQFASGLNEDHDPDAAPSRPELRASLRLGGQGPGSRVVDVDREVAAAAEEAARWEGRILFRSRDRRARTAAGERLLAARMRQRAAVEAAVGAESRTPHVNPF